METHTKSRRRLVAVGATAVFALVCAGCGSADAETESDEPPVPHHDFVSRPDLKPPELEFTQGPAWGEEYAESDEYIFLTVDYETETPSSAAMILDATGELVWMDPSKLHVDDTGHFDLRPQQYRGETILTYFKGPAAIGYGYGDIFLMNDQYQVFDTVTTGGSLPPHETDFHDAVITDDGTMLVLAYVKKPADLSHVGGPREGWIHDGVIQEIDIATGEVVFEWSSVDHVPLTEGLLDFDDEAGADAEEDQPELGTFDNPFDYFHINSATVDDDGAILASARHTNAVYKINRDTGDIEWTLGGVASDFALDDDAVFAWQHSAARDTDGTLTLFDNHARNADGDKSSRGLRLSLDDDTMTARVATEYLPPTERPAGSMANTQLLENGNMFIGWGQQPYYSEYTHDGELIYDVCHGDACHENSDGGGGSYRAYKGDWEGHPTTDPTVVVQQNGQGAETVYVSWNGATEVAQWRVLTGHDAGSTRELAVVDKTGFETAIPLEGSHDYVVIEALDADGAVLGTGTGQR
ncbi:arylsulfotransferase family protein [Enteractinococcus coprophilus]|uniref:Arylsulfotransferase ASST n=1 Tax=Enteractinococcus coprophilus TaxID=1027633 RepID=A0A543AG72_9MICC|nr:arylsulfotransferase family protein [Enteractinococcus coprophilus]TQL71570.1 arylsulfotransferase ASST [Enteractinococcus coprophilus]